MNQDQTNKLNTIADLILSKAIISGTKEIPQFWVHALLDTLFADIDPDTNKPDLFLLAYDVRNSRELCSNVHLMDIDPDGLTLFGEYQHRLVQYNDTFIVVAAFTFGAAQRTPSVRNFSLSEVITEIVRDSVALNDDSEFDIQNLFVEERAFFDMFFKHTERSTTELLSGRGIIDSSIHLMATNVYTFAQTALHTCTDDLRRATIQSVLSHVIPPTIIVGTPEQLGEMLLNDYESPKRGVYLEEFNMYVPFDSAFLANETQPDPELE